MDQYTFKRTIKFDFILCNRSLCKLFLLFQTCFSDSVAKNEYPIDLPIPFHGKDEIITKQYSNCKTSSYVLADLEGEHLETGFTTATRRAGS